MSFLLNIKIYSAVGASLSEAGVYVKSSRKVECLSKPLLVVFPDAEGASSVGGMFGEEYVKKTLRKYSGLMGNKLQILTAAKKGGKKKGLVESAKKKPSAKGLDSVLVDPEKKVVVFLEVKTYEFDEIFASSADEGRIRDQIMTAKDERGKVSERVKFRIDRCLWKNKKGTKVDLHQLSRKYCQDRLEHVLTHFPKDDPVPDLNDLIDGGGYSFMRLASLTVITGEEAKAQSAVSYYSIVRDGNSHQKEPLSNEARETYVNAETPFLRDSKELSSEDAERYLFDMYDCLNRGKVGVSVDWLGDIPAPSPLASPQKPAKAEPKKRLRSSDDGSKPEESRPVKPVAAAVLPKPPVVSDDDPRPSVYTADFRRKVAIAAMNKGLRSIKDICREFGSVSKTSVYAWMKEFKEGNFGEGTTTSAGPSAPPPPPERYDYNRDGIRGGPKPDVVETDEEVIDVEENDDEPAVAAPTPVSVVPKSSKKYPLEFKQKVALEAEVEGRKGVRDRKTLKEIAAKHEVNESTVSNWKRQFGPDSILVDLLSFNFKASELDALIERIEREPLIAEATISERFCEKNGLERCYGVFEGFNQCKTEAYGPMKQDFLDELKKRKIERERRQKKAAAAVSESDDSDVSSSEEDEVSPKYEHRKKHYDKYSDKDRRHKKHKHKKRDY